MRLAIDNRMFALLLAVLLAFVCLPSQAFAVGEGLGDQEAAAAADALDGSDGTDAGDGDASAAATDAEEAGRPGHGQTIGDTLPDALRAQVDEARQTAVERALSTKATSDDVEYAAIDSDSAGTVFTFQTPIERTAIESDLYWVATRLTLENSRVGNDVLGAGREVAFSHVDIGNDVRLVGQDVVFKNVIVQDNVNLGALDISIDAASAATGFYCGGGTISYEGKAKRFIAYGQSIYFDGVVEGDVTLSAQDIVIGPHARVTGTLDIRSGQNLEVLSIPETASIARIDTTLNQPNTIDQITQIRATIAPYFQVGSLLFVVVSFMLLGFALYWGFGHKLTEANRLIRRYPLAVVVLACIALMLMFVAVTLGALLVFTLPFAAVVLLALLMAAICCVPFTGASLALMLRNTIRPVLCVILGAGLGGALLFVPYVNAAVFVGSMIYFMGYLVNIAMFGHDDKHDASFHHRESDAEAPSGKASGILPVATTEDADAAPGGLAPSDDNANADWFVEGDPAEDDEYDAG